eukprot:1278290-Amphidinium_carterae.1
MPSALLAVGFALGSLSTRLWFFALALSRALAWYRETKNDNQYHSEQKKNIKFQEHRYAPKYWKNVQNGVSQ